MAEYAVVKWAEEHPYLAGATVFGGGLAILWLFGFFGPNKGSQSDGAGGSANMAGAYYAAEAQQAVVGGQIQMATIQSAADTAQMALQTDAAVKINASNDTTSQAIASSMYSADVTKAAYGAQTAQTLGAYDAQTAQTGIIYGAQTAQVQANDAMNTSVAHDAYAFQTNKTNADAFTFNNIINQIAAPEMLRAGSVAFDSPVGGLTAAYSGWTPATAAAAGYSPAQLSAMFDR
jgi:hypothetical protein